jgi:general secretion pathway protein L
MATHIGLDIGASSVKAAAMRVTFKKTRLEALSSIDIAQAGSLEEAMRQAIHGVTAGKPTVHDGVATALSGEHITVRVLMLPLSAQKQIGEVLPFELESELPFDTDDAVWDYRVLTSGRPSTAKDDQLAVLTTVVRTEEARERIDLMKSALGFEPERLGASVFPLANLVSVTGSLRGPAVAVVDLGVERSELLVLKEGEPAFCRTVLVGTSSLPAGAAKLARELRTTLAAYRAAGGVPVTKLVLAGGGAFVSGAESFLSQELAVPVERIEAPNVEWSPDLGPDAAAGFAKYAKAVGLALSLGAKPNDPNLRKGPLAFERGFAWVRDRLPTIVVLGSVALIMFLVSVVFEISALSSERGTLEKALETVTGEALGEATSSADRANELLAKESSLIDEDPLPHADAFDVMVRISESIPQSVVHDIDELDVQKGHVTVHGVVQSVNDAQEIAKNLKSERCFSDVKIKSTTQVVGGDRQKYVVEFDLKCPEDVKKSKKDSVAAATSASATSTGGK